MEKKAGILEYVSNDKPLSGIIKYRYSDFMVNEINQKDEVVKLTSTECNIEQKEEIHTKVEDCDITSEQLEALKNLQDSESMDIPIEDMDKGRRTKIHQYIKGSHPHLISSTVKNDSNLNVIRVTYGIEKRRGGCSMGSNDHCLFVMFKENKSTMEAIETMCRMLRVKTSTFSFAGTKDKRAVTSQLVTAFRVEPKRLSILNKGLKNLLLGNFSITKTPLKLGDLHGNAFKIVLRKVTNSLSEVACAMGRMELNGFINYFGTQRFGTTEVCNSFIGRCIVKSDWAGAIELILKLRNEENSRLTECRRVWSERRDPRMALEALAGYSCVERKLLEGLCRYSARNYVAALSMIPRNMRLMYLHAYQSLVWNRIASRRIRTHGLKVLLGDLFQKEGKDVKVVTEETLSEVSIADVVLPLAGHDVMMPHNEVKDWIEWVLSQDQLELKSFKHNIRDYCLAGGYRKLVMKPKDLKWELIEYEDDKEKLLVSDLDALVEGSNPTQAEPASSSEPQPDTLKKELDTPKEELNTPKEPLDILKEELDTPEKPLETPEGPQETPSSSLPPSTPVKQKQKALRMEFSLPPSTYATMLLRELTRVDTSSSHQSTLN